MPIIYKIDIINKLKSRGITTYSIRQNNYFSQSTVTKFNQHNTEITMKNVSMLCKLLNCQPADLIEYVPDEDLTKSDN